MCIRFLIGSNDGQVCVWKCGEGFRSLEPCFSIPLVSGSLQVGVTSIIDWALERTHTHVHAHNYLQCTNRPPVITYNPPLFRGIFLELSCNALTHMQTTPIVTILVLCALCVTPSPSPSLQNGFVNSLMFSHGGTFLVAAIGQEHRLGRWWTDKSVKNTIAIIPLKHSV